MAWIELLKREDCREVMNIAESRSSIGETVKVNYVYVNYNAKYDFFTITSENNDSCVAGYYNGKRIF